MNDRLYRNMLARLCSALLTGGLLSSCVSLGPNYMGVALTAINYTEDDYDAVGIAMPDDIKTFEAMDRASAYGGSGTMCCVALPEMATRHEVGGTDPGWHQGKNTGRVG